MNHRMRGLNPRPLASFQSLDKRPALLACTYNRLKGRLDGNRTSPSWTAVRTPSRYNKACLSLSSFLIYLKLNLKKASF